jgi:superfamily II DNA or RNA helicase
MSLLDEVEKHLAKKAKKASLLEEVEAVRHRCVLNETVFKEFLAENRQHQAQAIQAIKSTDRGQIVIPTGTGKTRVQVAILVGTMIEMTKQGKFGVFVIASHRLLLNKQLMDDYRDLCFRCNLPINVLYVGSAKHDDKAVYEKYFKQQGVDSDRYISADTTTSQKIKDFADKTKAAGRHLVIVSTYHSFERLLVLESIDICTYDEAHNTTSEDFNIHIRTVMPRISRNYFFTATRKVCKVSGRGMENEAVYGKVICDIGPQAMIEKGEIVKPRIISMMLDDEGQSKGVVSSENQHMLVKTVVEAFNKHKEAVKKESANAAGIGAKLLVSCNGSKELDLVQKSEEFKVWCDDKGVKVFSFSSRFGAIADFKDDANRNRVYDEMCSLEDKDDAILLHIDILAEGINLPSITGVLLLRHLNEIKLFQTLGRALRLMKVDRDRLYKGEILPQEREKYVKPYAYLILPMHFQDMDVSSEDMKKTIGEVIATYGIPVEEFLPPEGFKYQDFQTLDPVTNAGKIAKTKRDYPLLSVIEDIVMEDFSAKLPIDPKERYDTMMKAIKDFGKGKADA